MRVIYELTATIEDWKGNKKVSVKVYDQIFSTTADLQEEGLAEAEDAVQDQLSMNKLFKKFGA